jgi:Tol biopolymer transport system component
MGMKWRWLVAALLGITLVAGGILYFALRPQAVVVSPAEIEGGVSRFTPIEITFSQEMQGESVIENLQITPDVPGEYAWEGQTLRFTPKDGWPAGAEVSLYLPAGAHSSLGLTLAEETNWSFLVAPVKLAYLWPSDGNADIYLLDVELGDVRRLTGVGGVVSFSVSPDGLRFYYFAENTQGGTDLFVLDRYDGEPQRLLSCQRALCSEAAVSPGEGWLAYQRSDSQIWAFPLSGAGQAVRVSLMTETANFPLWAQEGVLSFYDTAGEKFVLYDLDEGREIESWHNQAGELGTWSPRGSIFIAPEFYELETDLLRGATGEKANQEVEESEELYVWVTSSQLRQYTVGEWQPVSITDVEMAEDYAPAYSPDGTRLVFTRRYLDEERWTPGRQVWLMSAAAGSGQRRQLTDAPDYEYSALSWHPDGDRLAAVRFNVTLLTEPPEIWLLELGGGATRLVIDGYAPVWVP